MGKKKDGGEGYGEEDAAEAREGLCCSKMGEKIEAENGQRGEGKR